MKAKKILALLCAAAMTMSLAACSSNTESKETTQATGNDGTQAAVTEEKTVEMDLATAYAGDGPAGIALAKYVEDVKTASNGSIVINLFTDGTLGNPSDNYASVASGDIDMIMSGLEALDLYAPEYTFLDTPFLIQNQDHLKALLDSGIGDSLKARYEDNGFVTLGFHYRDVRVLASNKEVTGPADVANLKLRLPGMTAYVDAWSAIGVSSTSVALGELYTALSTNVAEACEGGYEQMVTSKLYEVQKYMAETDHVYEFVGLYINKDKYDELSDNQKKILMDCATENLAYADTMASEKRAEYKQQCIDGGVTMVEIDNAAFREALNDYYTKQFSEKWNVTNYDEVMSYAK